MITSVEIKNFKSLVDLKLDLGRFNVLVGANGCGKSNILEGIAFGAAASADKLDYEFMGSRGIRLTRPEFMFSAFGDLELNEEIKVRFLDNIEPDFSIGIHYDSDSKKWVVPRDYLLTRYIVNVIEKMKDKDPNVIFGDNIVVEVKTALSEKIGDELPQNLKQLNPEYLINDQFSNYLLYCPEESSLRKFEETNQIYPLGRKGEGLFQYLKELTEQKDGSEIINEIKENLVILDWFDDIQIPDNLMSNEYSLRIKDRYLKETLQFFDQRSTNEGFLYLLFYLTLFISKDTPSFFAIDNLEASFNPKMCRELTRRLVLLAKKHNKQVIVTTHNPAILDGLDLADDDQRLFVVSRNDEGHTRARRIPHKEDRRLKLSEIWTNGYIGGLPDNF